VTAPAPASVGLDALDLLATLVALVTPDGRVLHANASFENLLGVPRRAMLGTRLTDWVVDGAPLQETLDAVSTNRIATGRFETELRRPVGVVGVGGGAAASPELLPVHVIVNQTERHDRVLVEMIEVEQQTKQDREERAATQAEANKELVRNLAHEIKNPLGGIRGAAQLLEMELEDKRELMEYTQVVIAECDRLQALVDRLLLPHRHAHVVADVNIHEVCERVRTLLAAEFPRGIALVRDYDTSIPEFRGDREQLIQAVLNIARNACQAMAERIAAGDAMLTFRSRVGRQVTIGKQRWRLALELHIEDNGPGVPESIRERIFYPLVTGREGGSGLGLTLAQTFVQQHQGTIECDSAPGRTVFTVLLPLP
jgi:two-component system, NtrC family, nitrogen regulation sensor histidine kinase GlnL